MMGVYGDWWGMSADELVRQFEKGDAHDATICSNILQARAAVDAAIYTRRTAWATWAVGGTAGGLALADIILRATGCC